MQNMGERGYHFVSIALVFFCYHRLINSFMFLDNFIIKLKSIYVIIFSKLLCTSENIFVMGPKLTPCLISNSETYNKGRVCI